MTRLFVTTLLLLGVCSTQAGELVFTNKTGATLNCWRQSGDDFLQFLKLTDNESRTFDDFTLPANLRCSAETTHISQRKSSTLLTHFKAESDGEYTALLQLIKCDDGCGQGWRTIIVMPNGEPYFTRYTHLHKPVRGRSSATIEWENSQE